MTVHVFALWRKYTGWLV